METGGYLSHGAIVAREYGLPAVVNIPGIFSQIQDAEVLIVDGDAGTVRHTLNPPVSTVSDPHRHQAVEGLVDS
jgi:phosphoenolpyruvate-protein kinase (PTS system EI component)